MNLQMCKSFWVVCTTFVFIVGRGCGEVMVWVCGKENFKYSSGVSYLTSIKKNQQVKLSYCSTNLAVDFSIK